MSRYSQVVLCLALLCGRQEGKRLVHCTSPSPWVEYTELVVPNGQYKFEDRTCNAVPQNVRVELPRRNSARVASGFALWGTPRVEDAIDLKYEQDVGRERTRISVACDLIAGKRFAFHQDSPIAEVDVVVVYGQDFEQRVCCSGQAVCYETPEWMSVVPIEEVLIVPDSVELGMHKLCADFIEGDSLVGPLSYNGSVPMYRGIPILSGRAKRFFGLALAASNAAWNGVQQYQIENLLAAMEKQQELNKENLMRSGLVALISNVRTQNTRRVGDYNRRVREENEFSLLRHITLENGWSEKERVRMQRFLNQFFVSDHEEKESVRRQLRRLALQTQREDPYLYVSADLGEECPAVEARWNGRVEVRKCDLVEPEPVILDNVYPGAQHYRLEGELYHEMECQLVSGTLAVSQNDSVVTCNGTSCFFPRSNRLVRDGVVSPLVFKTEQLSLPKADVVEARRIDDAANEAVMRSLGASSETIAEITDLLSKASMGGALGGLFGFLSSPCGFLYGCCGCSGCLECCALQGNSLLFWLYPWAVALARVQIARAIKCLPIPCERCLLKLCSDAE